MERIQPSQRRRVLDDERVVRADAQLGRTKSRDQMRKRRCVVHQRVVEQRACLFDWRALMREPKLFPTRSEPRQCQCESTSTMTEGDPQTGMALEHTAGDQRCGRNGGLAGKRY